MACIALHTSILKSAIFIGEFFTVNTRDSLSKESQGNTFGDIRGDSFGFT